MSDLDLTPQKIDTLMDALKAWESKDEMGALVGEIFVSMLSDKLSSEEKAKHAATKATEKQKQAEAKRIRMETSILLQAKLIQIRTRASVTSLTEGGAR